MMVGRKVLLTIDKEPGKPKDMVLSVDNLHVRDDRQHTVVDGVSLEVRAGEILGIAGVQGNGQTELTEALTGLRPILSGTVRIESTVLKNATPRQISEAGTGHVPEDRQKHGLVLNFPVRDNFFLNNYYRAPNARGIEINYPLLEQEAVALVRTFDVRTPTIMTNVGSLSGGNQQKVIVARELSRPIKLLIASQPTRGLDVGSIEFIHRRIVEARDKGAAVLLVSAELDEILSLSDRIAVMYKGRILDTLDAKDATREKLGLLMAGIHQEASHVE
jgi:simple sugar transport system ATP-binding protein